MGDRFDIIKPVSKIHDLNLWTKIIILLMIFPCTVFLSPPQFLIIPICFLFCLFKVSHITFKSFWGSSKAYIIFFLLGSTIFSLAFESGDILSRFLAGILWGARFDTVIVSSIFLSLVTDPIEIPMALFRMGIPHKYGITLMVSLRMIPLIRNGIYNVIIAQKARGLNWSFCIVNPYKLILQIMSLAVPCVFIALETSVGLSDTLFARGYDPYGKITSLPLKWKYNDVLIIFIAIAILLFILFYKIQPNKFTL